MLSSLNKLDHVRIVRSMHSFVAKYHDPHTREVEVSTRMPLRVLFEMSHAWTPRGEDQAFRVLRQISVNLLYESGKETAKKGVALVSSQR
jgi:hypothetical protein